MQRSTAMLALSSTVAAAALGGGAIFGRVDRTVHLSVDGRTTTVTGYLRHVSDALDRAHVSHGPHDLVLPDATSPVHDGMLVTVRHGRPLQLDVDGQQRLVWVLADSVDSALTEIGLRQPGLWLSASRSREIPLSGLSLSVRVPKHVTVLADRRVRQTMTTAPTVGDVLWNMHVWPRKNDRLNVSMNTPVRDGMVIVLTRIDGRTEIDQIGLPFQTKREADAALYVGNTEVGQYGVPGTLVRVYQLGYVNGKLTSRRLVKQSVAASPRDQIILVGSKPLPPPQPVSYGSGGGLNWAALAACESGGNPSAVSPDGTYRGLYQFTLGTWESVGGTGDPINASAAEQTYRAQLLYERAGRAAWPVCGQYL